MTLFQQYTSTESDALESTRVFHRVKEVNSVGDTLLYFSEEAGTQVRLKLNITTTDPDIMLFMKG